jgi:hypothetical protein
MRREAIEKLERHNELLRRRLEEELEDTGSVH